MQRTWPVVCGSKFSSSTLLSMLRAHYDRPSVERLGRIAGLAQGLVANC